MGQGKQNKDVRDTVDLTEAIYSAFLHTSLQRDKLTFLSHTRKGARGHLKVGSSVALINQRTFLAPH
ncbi:unnamed protein product [Boreogadus saida]